MTEFPEQKFARQVQRTCPDCAESVEADAKFCRQCGSALSTDHSAAGDSVLIAESPPPKPSMKVCNDCAEEIRSEAQFCRYCGHEQALKPQKTGSAVDDLCYAIDASDFSRAVSLLPPQEQSVYHAEVDRLRKHIGVAYLYWFVIIGIFGAQKFYLREFKWGALYLCCTILSGAFAVTALSLMTFDALVTKAISFSSIPLAILCAATFCTAGIVGTGLCIDLYCIPNQVARYNDRMRREILIGIARRLRPNSFVAEFPRTPALFPVVAGLIISAVATAPFLGWVVSSHHSDVQTKIADESSKRKSPDNAFTNPNDIERSAGANNMPATDWDGSEGWDGSDSAALAPLPIDATGGGGTDAPSPIPVAAGGGGRGKGGGGGGQSGAPTPVRASYGGGGGGEAAPSPVQTTDVDGEPLALIQGGANISSYLNDGYMKEIQRQIKKHWLPPKDLGPNTAVVLFKIHSTGHISDLRIESSSGNHAADIAALKAVEDAVPFSPLPFGAQENVDIKFSFNYKPPTSRREF